MTYHILIHLVLATINSIAAVIAYNTPIVFYINLVAAAINLIITWNHYNDRNR